MLVPSCGKEIFVVLLHRNSRECFLRDSILMKNKNKYNKHKTLEQDERIKDDH